MSIRQLLSEAEQEFKNWIEDHLEEYDEFPDHDAVTEAITEIADSSVPVYNHDLLELALDDLWLACTEPDIGAAFGGEKTAVNIIAACVYERVYEALVDYWESYDFQDQEDEETKDV